MANIGLFILFICFGIEFFYLIPSGIKDFKEITRAFIKEIKND